jgi:phosphoribosyl 1,2-cyclic phosphodiesterase
LNGRIWGCRGSLATPGASTVRVGGNTSCVEVRSDTGAVVVLDAGTGIRALGAQLAAEGVREVDLLLTHLHLDHVEGLGFFAPFFDPECTVRIRGPVDERPLRERLGAYLAPPWFPLRFETFPAQIEVHDVEPGSFAVAGLEVQAAWTCHPGPTLAYRLADARGSLAYVSDNEPGRDSDAAVALARGAGVLLHDAQYTDEEYATRQGWGHASISDFASFVRATEPREVLMFHHDPSHPDDALEALEAVARSACGRDDVRLAREGMDFTPLV